MFISSTFLEINYGVDDEIAVFFVDREPPANNLYWQGKLLYLRPAPGYLFIPLIVDLLYRLKIDRQELLSERFVKIMEDIGHISALEETRQITADEAIKKGTELVKGICMNKTWYHNLVNYFNNKEDNFFSRLSGPFKALHRGDLFLFALCALSLREELYERVAEQWFALISILLLLDDAEDLASDKKTGDENAFIESGLHEKGRQKIEELVKNSLIKIGSLSPVMAFKLKSQYEEFAVKILPSHFS